MTCRDTDTQDYGSPNSDNQGNATTPRGAAEIGRILGWVAVVLLLAALGVVIGWATK